MSTTVSLESIHEFLKVRKEALSGEMIVALKAAIVGEGGDSARDTIISAITAGKIEFISEMKRALDHYEVTEAWPEEDEER